MSLSNCAKVPMTEISQGSFKLELPYISDEELPYISILTPVYKRNEFGPLMVRNFKKINYPRELLEWVIVDDSSPEESLDLENFLKKEIDPSDNVRFIKITKKLDLGLKRNLMCQLASYDYIVHFDSDDFYPETSVIARIRSLLYYEKIINFIAFYTYKHRSSN